MAPSCLPSPGGPSRFVQLPAGSFPAPDGHDLRTLSDVMLLTNRRKEGASAPVVSRPFSERKAGVWQPDPRRPPGSALSHRRSQRLTQRPLRLHSSSRQKTLFSTPVASESLDQSGQEAPILPQLSPDFWRVANHSSLHRPQFLNL